MFLQNLIRMRYYPSSNPRSFVATNRCVTHRNDGFGKLNETSFRLPLAAWNSIGAAGAIGARLSETGKRFFAPKLFRTSMKFIAFFLMQTGLFPAAAAVMFWS